jgi:hypothetical protein
MRRGFVNRLLGAPLLHFGGVGIAVFAAVGVEQWYSDAAPDRLDQDLLYQAAITLGIDREASVVGKRLAELGAFLEVHGSGEQGATEREARDLGLVTTDPIIRRHVEQLAELALRRGGLSVLPTEDEVAEYYATHARRFVEPPRARLTQMYFSSARRGADAEAAAVAALVRVRAERLSPANVVDWGDPFVQAFNARSATHDELAQVLGDDLASAAVDSAPVDSWAGPFRSPYGFHLIWVHQRTAASRVPLTAVRNQIVHRLVRERGALLAARRLELVRQAAAGQMR